jgi:preprotein translocase subunit SecB
MENSKVIVNAQYIKDLSFESPKPPISLKQQPKIEFNVDINARKLGDNLFEVSLKTKVRAISSAEEQEDVIFLAELDYAGIFTIENVPDENKEEILLIYCPNLIFPFARRVIANTTSDGGYPALMMDPIDFAKLYHERKTNGDPTEGGDKTLN